MKKYLLGEGWSSNKDKLNEQKSIGMLAQRYISPVNGNGPFVSIEWFKISFCSFNNNNSHVWVPCDKLLQLVLDMSLAYEKAIKDVSPKR